jgi:hypothetical protein
MAQASAANRCGSMAAPAKSPDTKARSDFGRMRLAISPDHVGGFFGDHDDRCTLPRG